MVQYSLGQEDHIILYSFGSWDGLWKINLQLHQPVQIPVNGGMLPLKLFPCRFLKHLIATKSISAWRKHEVTLGIFFQPTHMHEIKVLVILYSPGVESFWFYVDPNLYSFCSHQVSKGSQQVLTGSRILKCVPHSHLQFHLHDFTVAQMWTRNLTLKMQCK